jgi:RNA polymerase sigma-70 factor (ECF subfamily)
VRPVPADPNTPDTPARARISPSVGGVGACPHPLSPKKNRGERARPERATPRHLDPPVRPPDFTTLLAAYHPLIFRFLVRLCAADRHTAEDLTQETFLRAFRAFDRLRPDANHRAWLYRIAYNTFLDDRRRHRHREVELDEGRASTTSSDDARELVAAVLAFVQTLPTKQRAALILRRVEGREYDEVAQILGCSEDSARANAYQALKKLRERFSEEY